MYGNVICSNVNVSLVGLNLTRFTWHSPNVKVNYYRIKLTKMNEEKIILNTTVNETNLDVFNLEFNQR